MTTDKQIIIDGVDVTNCIHRATNKLCGDIDPYCRCYTGSCKDISNCHYKNWKRAEQQYERLKETFKFVLDETIKEHRLYESKLERIIYEQLL